MALLEYCRAHYINNSLISIRKIRGKLCDLQVVICFGHILFAFLENELDVESCVSSTQMYKESFSSTFSSWSFFYMIIWHCYCLWPFNISLGLSIKHITPYRRVQTIYFNSLLMHTLFCHIKCFRFCIYVSSLFSLIYQPCFLKKGQSALLFHSFCCKRKWSMAI